jgi:hypothetical protein
VTAPTRRRAGGGRGGAGRRGVELWTASYFRRRGISAFVDRQKSLGLLSPLGVSTPGSFFENNDT